MAAKHAAQQASKWDLVGGMKPSAVAAAAVLLVCSCWNPAACGSKGNGGGGGVRGGTGGRKQRVDEDDGGARRQAQQEVLDVGPVAVSAAVGSSTNAVKRPFRAMYEQRGRLFTVEFLERRAAQGVTLETLKPALV